MEEEPLPSSSDKLEQCSEIANQNLIEDNNSNDSTPINSRSSKIIKMKYCILRVCHILQSLLSN